MFGLYIERFGYSQQKIAYLQTLYASTGTSQKNSQNSASIFWLLGSKN